MAGLGGLAVEHAHHGARPGVRLVAVAVGPLALQLERDLAQLDAVPGGRVHRLEGGQTVDRIAGRTDRDATAAGGAGGPPRCRGQRRRLHPPLNAPAQKSCSRSSMVFGMPSAEPSSHA